MKPPFLTAAAAAMILVQRTSARVCALPLERIDATSVEERIDGYLTFCPCMGRLGNQLSQFLGVLSLSRRLRRTLLLPPLVEYIRGVPKARMVPFENYFNVSKVNEYVPAMSVESFLSSDASVTAWPPETRGAWCTVPRAGLAGCGAKAGNPFGPFWDYLGVDFVEGGDVVHGPVTYLSPERRWSETYPASEYPVMAFVGAPAAFPEREEDRRLQRYVDWTDRWKAKGRTWRDENMPNGPVVGVHMRNGSDWVKDCNRLADRQVEQMFASPQCLGYNNEHGKVTKDLCLPEKETVVRQVRSAVDQIDAKGVFVATDNDNLHADLREVLPGDVVIKSLNEDDFRLDLVILSQSDLFVGNCVSTFTAIVTRMREFNEEEKDRPTQFWAFSERVAIDESEQDEEEL